MGWCEVSRGAGGTGDAAPNFACRPGALNLNPSPSATLPNTPNPQGRTSDQELGKLLMNHQTLKS